MDFLPGTSLPVEDITVGFTPLTALLIPTGGLTLSQVCSLTGLEPTTTQNWIKRGWVAHPENKKYGEYQLARILIINALRTALSLENIAFLLRYVNGEADDRNDDIIPDAEMYTLLCCTIGRCVADRCYDTQSVRLCAEKVAAVYDEKYPGARTKLVSALSVMTLGYLSAVCKQQADAMLSEFQ